MIGFKDLNSLLLTEYEPPVRYWGPILEAGRIVLVYGPRGCGKSWLTTSLAHQIAAGGRFLKFDCGKARVVAVDGEMGLQAVRFRLRLINNSYVRQPPGGDLLVVTPDQQPEGVIPNLADPYTHDWWNALAERCDVIVIDNLNTVSAPRDGRDDEIKQWLRIQSWLLKQRNAGKSIVVVHHAGKGGQQLGTSHKENIADTILSIRKPVLPASDTATELEVRIEKSRHFHGSDTESFLARFSSTPDRMSWEYLSLREYHSRCISKLKASGLKQQAVAAQLNLPAWIVAQEWDHLLAAGEETVHGHSEVSNREEPQDELF